MPDNPSRQTGPFDRWSQDAKEDVEYWLCECGLARKNADNIIVHLDEEGHFAERVNKDQGQVTGFIAGGLSSNKYGSGVPDSANLQRRRNKNEPLFEDPEY